MIITRFISISFIDFTAKVADFPVIAFIRIMVIITRFMDVIWGDTFYTPFAIFMLFFCVLFFSLFIDDDAKVVRLIR